MRLKQTKQTGKTTREYLSMSEGLTPSILLGLLKGDPPPPDVPIPPTELSNSVDGAKLMWS